MKKVLFLGAHYDDIELGCGGTVFKNRNEWDMTAAIFSSSELKNEHWDNRPDTTNLRAVSDRALNFLGINKIETFLFPNSGFDLVRNDIWQIINSLKKKFEPDIVFTHHADTHQDHETLHNETLRNFRSEPVFCYRPHGRDVTEFCPNTFSVLSEVDVDRKLEALSYYNEIFGERSWFKTVKAEMSVFGIKVDQEYAEGFETVRNLI